MIETLTLLRRMHHARNPQSKVALVAVANLLNDSSPLAHFDVDPDFIANRHKRGRGSSQSDKLHERGAREDIREALVSHNLVRDRTNIDDLRQFVTKRMQ